MKKLLQLRVLSVLTLLSFCFGSAFAAKYTKITTASELTDGKYLIVYDINYAFDGSRKTLDAVNNYYTNLIDANVSPFSVSADIYFTIAAVDDGYSIQSASGYYIGQTSDANGLKSSTSNAYVNTISFDANGNADIVSGGAYLRFNNTSNQLRFRYYTSSKYTNQQAINLYKEVVEGGEESSDPTIQAVSTLDFGTCTGTPEAKTLTVTGKNLDAAIAYAWETTGIFSATGELTAEGGELSIALDKTEAGEYSDNLILTSGETSLTVAVSAKVVHLSGQGEGTETSPYEVTRALDIINNGLCTSENVYVKGVVKDVTEVSTQHGNATFTLVDNITDENALTIYRVKYLNNASFTPEDQIKANDEVVAYGVLTDFVKNEVHTPELINGYLTSITSDGQQATSIYATSEVKVQEGKTANISATVKCNGEIVEGAIVSYETSNAAIATVDESGVVTGVAAGSATITVTYEGNEDFLGSTAQIAVTVTIPLEGEGTLENPYTVSDIKDMNVQTSDKNKYWVVGYIIGSCTSSTKLNEAGSYQASNIAIAGEPSTEASFVPVELPKGDVRNALNVKDNPSNLYREVKVYGTLESYFSTAGVKNVTAYVLESEFHVDVDVTTAGWESGIYAHIVNGAKEADVELIKWTEKGDYYWVANTTVDFEPTSIYFYSGSNQTVSANYEAGRVYNVGDLINEGDDAGKYNLSLVSESTGVEAIEAEAGATAEYFNLQGVRVLNPENGVFVRRMGNKVEKVVIR